MNFQHTNPYGSAPSDPIHAWGYAPQAPPLDRNSTFPPPVLPSIHSFGRTTSPVAAMAMTTSGAGEVWHSDSAMRDASEMISYRAWHPDTSYPAMDNSGGHHVFGSPPVDPALRGLPPPSSASNPNARETNQWSQPAMTTDMPTHQNRYSQEGFNPVAPTSQFDNSMYASASYAQHAAQAPYYSGSYVQNVQNTPPPPPASAIPPLPRHTYTRTLVGPLSANACRLLDEHRKPGIFFLFQDLSVRTEGIGL